MDASRTAPVWYPNVAVGTPRATTGTAASIAVDVMASSADEGVERPVGHLDGR